MAFRMQSILNSLPLTAAELASLAVPKEEISEGLAECNRSLIGKFISAKDVPVRGLKTAIDRAWKTPFSVQLAKNVYQFVFIEEENPSKLIEPGPWSFDGHLLVLIPWQDDWEDNEHIFDFCDFWIHILEFPLFLCTASLGKRLASAFSSSKSIQLMEEITSGHRFFRIRIRIKVEDPLHREISLSPEGRAEIRFVIQFERLPTFCFSYGLLSHTLRACKVQPKEVTSSQEKRIPFGTWLHANRKSRLLLEIDPSSSQDVDMPVLLTQGEHLEDPGKKEEQNKAPELWEILVWCRDFELM